MRRFSVVVAAVLLMVPFTEGQEASAQGDGKPPPTQCWDQSTKQVRQRSAADAPKDVTTGAGSTTESTESGSSEGMAGLAPGSKGPASKQAASESASPGGSGRPPGMPNC